MVRVGRSARRIELNAATPQEVRKCRTEYSDSYICVIEFDNIKQCQTMSFIVHKPKASRYSFGYPLEW